MREDARRDCHQAMIDSLVSRGTDDLSDFELLTLLFGGCVPLAEAESCAREYTQEIGPPTSLEPLDFTELTWIKGIGKAKAAAIVSGVELGRRSVLHAFRNKALQLPLDNAGATSLPGMTD